LSGFEVRDSGFEPLSNGVPQRKKLRRFPAPKVQLELGRKLHLDLDGNARVLLGPKLGYECGDPLPYREEAVHLGVAGGTEYY
jgi:hypothetical protein